MPGMIEIVSLTPERRAEWLALFDGKAFADNPEWSGCYCRCYHFKGTQDEWDAEPAEANRAAACELISTGTMQGWLAMRDGEAVGWINAGPKRIFAGLSDDDVPGLHDSETAMVTCFLIEPASRGAGIASRLLDAAIDGLRRKGMRRVEAKPAKNATGQARNYHGPLAMYEKSGFKIVGAFSESQYLVRLEL